LTNPINQIRLKLKAVAPVGDPDADGVDEFPGGDRRDMADDRHQVAFAARLYLEHGKTIVIVVERHAFDGPDERFTGGGCVERRLQAGTNREPKKSTLKLACA
jgi:hypothetical protein